MGIDFFDKPYGHLNPVKRPYINKRLDTDQSNFAAAAQRTIADSYEADTFAGTSLYIAYALRVDSAPGQRVRVKAWCRKTHPSFKAFAPASFEDDVNIDKFPTYVAIKDSLPPPNPGEKIWVEYGNSNLEAPRYMGPVNDREHLVGLVKSVSAGGAFGGYPCGALNSNATNVGALGGTSIQGNNIPASSTGLPQTNRKSSDLTGENVFINAPAAPARQAEQASWRKNVEAAGCRESRNWIGKLTGNRNKSVVIHIPGTTDLNLPLETYVWIHGAGGNNPSGKTWEFLPRLSKKMGEAGRNFILIFPVVAPASSHHSGGSEGSIGDLVNQSIEVVQTRLAPGTQIQIAYRTIAAHSAGGGIMARSALDPRGLIAYQPDKITLADITGIGDAFTKIWENYMQRVNKAVELNILGSGTTYGAQGKNGPKVEGQIQQFFSKVIPASTTPNTAYTGDLTLQIQKPNGAIQYITRANIQGLNHTTYAFAGYEYINPAAARKNSNKTRTSRPEPIKNGQQEQAPAGVKFLDFMRSESRKLGIEVEMGLAILRKESGGKSFCPNGKMLVRFEPHSFIKHVRKKYGEDKARLIPWHGCKNTRCDEWKSLGFNHVSKCAGNWEQEFLKNMKSAIEWCAQNGVDDEYVYRCASYGAPQVMGFNHSKLGYTSAKTMFEAFAASEMAQLKGMFNYFVGRQMVEDIKRRDFIECSKKYNGSTGYAPGFEKYYNEYKAGGMPPNREMITHGAQGAAIAKELAAANPLASSPGPAPAAANCATVATVGSTVNPALPPAEGRPQSVANAIAELEFWGRGSLKEPYHRSNRPNNPNFQKAVDRLTLYWGNLGWNPQSAMSKRIEPQSAWSAATISYFHRHDKSFPKRGSHRKYMVAAKKNRDLGAKTGWIAYKPEEIGELQPGDIVCAGRSQDGSAISTFDKIQPYNHCDLCITRDQAVGGNVASTCKISKITYINGVATGLGKRNPSKAPIMMVIRKVGPTNQNNNTGES